MLSERSQTKKDQYGYDLTYMGIFKKKKERKKRRTKLINTENILIVRGGGGSRCKMNEGGAKGTGFQLLNK